MRSLRSDGSVFWRSLSGMARKQSRRSVSLNRNVYEAAKEEAGRRGVALSGLVELALEVIGVSLVEHPRQTPALVAENMARRAESGGANIRKA